jgi:hypothetical protein
MRGTEPDVQFSGFAQAQLNGNFRVIAGDGSTWGDPFCTISGNYANGPTNTASLTFASFAFFNPAAYTAGFTTGCTGSACGANAQIQGITYLAYLGPSPTSTVLGDGIGGTCGGGTGSGGADDQYCAITLLGQAGTGTQVAAGAVLKNIGVLANGNPGVGGVASIYGQEGSGWINDSTAYARVPGPTGAVWSSGANINFSSVGDSSQNFYTFQGFEDYCNNTKPTQQCMTAAEGAGYGPIAVASVNSSGVYTWSTTNPGAANSGYVGYQFTVTGFTGGNNQTAIVTASSSTTFTLGGTTTAESPVSGSVSGTLGLHLAFICNDDWTRTCVDNLTANYKDANRSPAVWVNGVSDPASKNSASGSAGPVLIGRVHGQNFNELLLIGDQEPTKDISVTSLHGDATGLKYAAIVSCNFNGGNNCPPTTTGLTTPAGYGNTTSDIGISNANGGGPNATIWDQFENANPITDCPPGNNTTPGCWTDAAILDWKMHNCTLHDAACTGPGLFVTTTSSQFFPSAPAYQSSSFAYPLANNTTTGTVLNELAILTGAPSTSTVATTLSTTGVIGLVVAGAGTSGSATIQFGGVGPCIFDNTVTAGDYVQASTSSGGECHDAGATKPLTGQILGRATTSGSAATPQSVFLQMTQ